MQMARKRKNDADPAYKGEIPAKRTCQSTQKPPPQAKRGRPPQQSAPAQGPSKQPARAQAKCKFSYDFLSVLHTILTFYPAKGKAKQSQDAIEVESVPNEPATKAVFRRIPCNMQPSEFPQFHDGDVFIFLEPGLSANSPYQYKLHSDILERASHHFHVTLQLSVVEADEKMKVYRLDDGFWARYEFDDSTWRLKRMVSFSYPYGIFSFLPFYKF